MVSEREALERERRRLEAERQVFRQEKDSFLRARTAPDGQTGSDEESTDMTSLYRRRADSTSSSVGSFRTPQNTHPMRPLMWHQNYPSLYAAGPRVGKSYQGWVGYQVCAQECLHISFLQFWFCLAAKEFSPRPP